jgi:hypothetical protein
MNSILFNQILQSLTDFIWRKCHLFPYINWGCFVIYPEGDECHEVYR